MQIYSWQEEQIKKIINIFKKYELNSLGFLKRFLDDLFKIYKGTTQNLHKIIQEMNNIHPSIKFTMSHTSNIHEDPSTRCDCPNRESIPFLDTSCKIIDGRIILDLYKKTYRSQYVLIAFFLPSPPSTPKYTLKLSIKN